LLDILIILLHLILLLHVHLVENRKYDILKKLVVALVRDFVEDFVEDGGCGYAYRYLLGAGELIRLPTQVDVINLRNVPNELRSMLVYDSTQ
jgi:hypothetical protein